MKSKRSAEKMLSEDLRHMKPRNRGAIVQVSSGLAIRAAPLQAAYCGAKFAVTGFTDALRAELIADAVDVSLSIVYLPSMETATDATDRPAPAGWRWRERRGGWRIHRAAATSGMRQHWYHHTAGPNIRWAEGMPPILFP